MTADRSGWPTREIELLIAEARPALPTGIDDISVLVSGATTSEMPTPNSRIMGRMSTKVDVGGTNDEGLPIARRHGSVSAGMRASHRSPPAISNGPAMRNRRGPYRPASVPIRADSTVSRMPLGTPITPAAVAL